jgi:hypothetical protein
MLQELLFAHEETCPYCGGVHLTIEQKDALHLRDDQTDRCNLTGPFTVCRAVLKDRLFNVMADLILKPGIDSVVAKTSATYLTEIENALWDFFQAGNRICLELNLVQPLFGCTVRHHKILNELAMKKEAKNVGLEEQSHSAAEPTDGVEVASWQPVRATYGTLYLREEFLRLVADGEITSNNGTAVPCKYIDERLHESTPVHIQLLPLKEMSAEVTHINFIPGEN